MIHLVSNIVMRLFGLVAINKIPDEPFSHLAHSWDDVMGVWYENTSLRNGRE